MRLSNILKIVRRDLTSTSAREKYWKWSPSAARWKNFFRRENRAYRKLAIRSYLSFVFHHPNPIEGETDARIHAAARWLAHCQDATDDDGAALGYFPLEEFNSSAWRPSYPETTGYIIQSFIEYAERYNRPEMLERAKRMAIWETEVQMPNGGVQSGVVCPPDQQSVAVFNTGMVLQGYTSALMVEPVEPIVSAARRAADFLLSDLGSDGHFQSHGTAVSWHKIKTYNVLCAWALQRYGQITGGEKYLLAAVRAAEAAVGQQDNSGWFANCCLDCPDYPLTHTIGYTLQGLLEVGVGAKRDDFISAVQKGIEPIMSRISAKGFLRGRFYRDWEPGCFNSCLTGSAQVAIVSYRLFELTKEVNYLKFADQLLNFLKNFQKLESDSPALIGCIPSCYPALGSYLSGSYPNWATKYFLDALMLRDRLDRSAVVF